MPSDRHPIAIRLPSECHPIATRGPSESRLSPHSTRSSSKSPNFETVLIWQLVVHEILGHIASAEGVVKALRELHTRAGQP